MSNQGQWFDGVNRGRSAAGYFDFFLRKGVEDCGEIWYNIGLSFRHTIVNTRESEKSKK
jgi:hypothetical protein